MPLSDWKRMVVFSLTTMVCHSLKLGFFLMMYLADRFAIKYTDFISFISEGKIPQKTAPLIHSELEHFYGHIERILQGKGRGVSAPEYGEISWDVEEASFLRISENLDTFYNELEKIIVHYLNINKINFHKNEIKEVVKYQKCRIPQLLESPEREVSFSFNFPKYFDSLLSDFPESLSYGPQTILVKQKDYQANKQVFAKEIILWGRKSGTNLTDIEFLSETSRV
tara:strand:- start:44 stop:718 length:675 start_codon:yes stop_codon:yes gene_type:complete